MCPVLATACCPRWLAPGSLRRGPGARGSTSPLTSRSPAPSVTHVSHTKPRWLREQAVGCAPREPGASGPHRAWPACRPCGHSPRAVRTGSLRAELTLFLADRRERDPAAWRRGACGPERRLGGPALPFSAAPVSAVQCAGVALSADPGTQPREQGQMWSPLGGGQGPGGPHVQGGRLLL